MNNAAIRRWAEKTAARASELQEEIEIQSDDPDEEVIALLSELSLVADSIVARLESRTLYYDADKEDREGFHEEAYDLD